MARPGNKSVPKALLSSPAAFSGCSADAAGHASDEAILALVALIARLAAREMIVLMDARGDSTVLDRGPG